MNRRLSVRLPEGLALGLVAQAMRQGKTRSEIVRDALEQADVHVPTSIETRREALRRATEFRARQTRVSDAAQLVREGREELERRSEPERPPRARPRCAGRRGPPSARTTPGFQSYA